MKNLKDLMATILFIGSIFLVIHFQNNTYVYWGVGIVIPSFLLLNWSIRKSLNYKSYFLSKYNIFTAKYSNTIQVDLSVNTAFEKLKEVLDESSFKIVDINYDDYEILVISKMSVWSLSENLYLSVQSTSNGSKILVEISTLFSVYSWGKNEENFKNLFKKFEESFII